MRTSTAAVGSAAFFVVAPGTFVGLGPWLITHWEIPGFSPPLRVILGVVLIVLGLIPPVHAFIQFVKAGGTPMPVAPTERLVVTGFNRFVRNPMYVGLLTAIAARARRSRRPGADHGDRVGPCALAGGAPDRGQRRIAGDRGPP